MHAEPMIPWCPLQHEKKKAFMKSNATAPEAAEDVCPTFEFECTANTRGGWLRSWCLNSRQDLYDHKYGSVGFRREVGFTLTLAEWKIREVQ